MCGIFAQVGKLDTEEVRYQALNTIAHRGPDAEGSWESSQHVAWLAQRRLAIVDLSEAGRQPMHNEDSSIWLVCNGEIYNYPSLRPRLEGLGHAFYSNSDSEVILHAYEQWGQACVDYLEGMFAFIVWDENKQTMLCARDRVGIKPLYFAETGNGLTLASEVRALLPFVERKPDPMALAYIMTLGYVPSPLSIWQGIRKLEPAHIMTWQAETGTHQCRYWSPPAHIDPSANPSEWQGLYETVLQEHLLSDVPIGLFLSGGLDSSAIAAGLRDIQQTVQAITIGYPDSQYNESPIARELARHLGFPHTVVDLQENDVNALLREEASAFDEPQGYSALLSMLMVCRYGGQNFKVILAGDGGDELFGGYTWYRDLGDGSSKSATWIRRTLRPIVRRNASPTIRQRAAQYFSRISPLHRHAWRLYPRFLPEEVEALLEPMGLRFGDNEMLAPLQKYYEPSLPLQRALQRVDLMTFCSDSILAKVDRASMAYSLEVRVPFLDRRMVEWALPRPMDIREQVESKPVLRDYLRSRAPGSVLDHPKQGFSLRVLNDFDWDAALDRIRASKWVQDGYWVADWERLVAHGVPYRNARIWNLLVLSNWAEYWFV